MKKFLYILGCFLLGMLIIAGITFIVDYSTDNKISDYFDKITCKHEFKDGICIECGKNTRKSLAFEKNTDFTGKIMFDTSKSTEEVVAVMEKLDYTLVAKDSTSEKHALLAASFLTELDGTNIILNLVLAKNIIEDNTIYVIKALFVNAASGEVMNSEDIFQTCEDDGFIGWNPDLNCLFELESAKFYAVGTEKTAAGMTLKVDDQQDKYTEIVYLVEVDETENSTDSTTDSEKTTNTTTGTTTTE